MEGNVIDFGAPDLFATELFVEQIGNYAERPFIEQLSADFERRELRAVVRPWEELEVSGRFAPTYTARKKKLDDMRAKSPRKALSFSASDKVLKEELERYLRMPRAALLQATEVDGQRRQIYVERIHELQAALGAPLTDFSKPLPKVDTPDYEKLITDFRGMPAAERLRTVTELTDRVFLGYVVTDEQDSQIRAAAQARLVALATE